MRVLGMPPGALCFARMRAGVSALLAARMSGKIDQTKTPVFMRTPRRCCRIESPADAGLAVREPSGGRQNQCGCRKLRKHCPDLL